MTFWCDVHGHLHRSQAGGAAAERIDPLTLRWTAVDAEQGQGVRRLAAIEAVAHLMTEQRARRLPVAVIGPRAASPEELEHAHAAANRLAHIGFPVLCGGREGAMEAASRGAREAGGLVIGALPDGDWRHANPFVDVPLATGLGEARNAVIASSAFALIAVGGGHGTLSEMALGLRLGRLVVALPHAVSVDGAHCCATVEQAIEAVVERYLAMP